jgi:hypothetical protein
MNEITLDFFKNTNSFLTRLKCNLQMHGNITSSKLNKSMFNSSNRPSEDEWNNILNDLESIGLIRRF